MRFQNKLWTAIIVGIICMGCAESSDFSIPESDSIYMPYRNGGDAADCIFNEMCDNAFEPRTGLYKGYFEGTRTNASADAWPDGIYEYIDDACHKIASYAAEPYTGDVDIFGIDATVGTPLKITASAYASGSVKPVLTLFDAEGRTLTASMDVDKNGTASVMFFAPSNDRFYASVEDSRNYDMGWASACSNDYVGGKSYGYLFKVEKASNEDDITVLEFGDLGVNKPEFVYDGHISKNGEVQYFSWRALKGTSFTVKLEPKDQRFKMIWSPINRSDGRYIWYATGSETYVLQRTLVPANAVEAGDNVIYTIALADEIGQNGYDYTLSIIKK